MPVAQPNLYRRKKDGVVVRRRRYVNGFVDVYRLDNELRIAMSLDGFRAKYERLTVENDSLRSLR